jgi:hypothetical protein
MSNAANSIQITGLFIRENKRGMTKMGKPFVVVQVKSEGKPSGKVDAYLTGLLAEKAMVEAKPGAIVSLSGQFSTFTKERYERTIIVATDFRVVRKAGGRIPSEADLKATFASSNPDAWEEGGNNGK